MTEGRRIVRSSPAAFSRFAARLRSQVPARRVGRGADGAHVDHAAHAGGLAGGAQVRRQANVNTLEFGFAAVQDGHEIDHRFGVAQHARQRGLVVHVACCDLHGGQELQVLGVGDATRRDAEATGTTAGSLDQFFADAAAHDARRAEDQDVARSHQQITFMNGEEALARSGGFSTCKVT
jgi:hypothetical protein